MLVLGLTVAETVFARVPTIGNIYDSCWKATQYSPFEALLQRSKNARKGVQNISGVGQFPFRI